MSELAVYEPPPPDRGHMFFDPSAFRHAMEVAGVLAQSQLVPPNYRGKPADVLLAMNLARRMGEDPLTILQVVTMVHNKPGWHAPFLISRMNQHLAEPIDFEVTGSGPSMAVTCKGTLRRGGARSFTVPMQMAVDEGWASRNAKYKSMPQLMLSYRAATFFCRLYMPELLFGLPVVDELTDTDDTVPVVPSMREGVQPRGTAAIDRMLGVGFPTHAPDDGPVVPETPALPAPPAKVEAPKANAASDAALLRNALTTLPLGIEDARRTFREAAGIQRVSEERWRALLGVGILKGWWAATDTQLTGPIGAAPDALPPEPDPKADTEDDGLAPGELQLKVAVAEERADEARVLAAAQAAGLPIVDGLPVTDGAPDSMLRRYLAELTKEVV